MPCTSQKDNNGIKLEGNKLTIILDELPNGEIQHWVWGNTEIEELIVTQKATDGWIALPPASYYSSRKIEPPYFYLPDNIKGLKNLSSIYTVNINLREVPNAIVELEKLTSINFSINKLTLTNEMPKFARLSNLRELILLGNRFDENEMDQFIIDHQHINVEYKAEV